MKLLEFNLRFLEALDFIHPKLKHTAAGTGGYHPNLRRELLRAVKDDLRIDGLEATITKHRNFLFPLRPQRPVNESHKEKEHI